MSEDPNIYEKIFESYIDRFYYDEEACEDDSHKHSEEEFDEPISLRLLGISKKVFY